MDRQSVKLKNPNLPLLLLASGYLFTAIAATTHALSFPGLFTPTGLFNAGPQTTVWLFMVWHGGFPLLALGYALLKDTDGGVKIRGPSGTAILGSVVAVCVLMCALVWVVTGKHDMLRIVDESGEDYLYPKALFRPIALPQAVKRAVLAA